MALDFLIVFINTYVELDKDQTLKNVMLNDLEVGIPYWRVIAKAKNRAETYSSSTDLDSFHRHFYQKAYLKPVGKVLQENSHATACN